MKTRLAIALAILTLTGCGTAARLNAPGKPLAGLRAHSRGTIVELPAVPVGVSQKVSGKYKTYKITGDATVKALDDAKLDVAAKLSAKVSLITVTKNVTFGVTRRADDATWPYQFTVVNVTDKETFSNKAQITSAVNGTTNFKLDDGTTALIAADGQGNARVVNGDFDITFGKTAKGPFGPSVANPPSMTDWFKP